MRKVKYGVCSVYFLLNHENSLVRAIKESKIYEIMTSLAIKNQKYKFCRERQYQEHRKGRILLLTGNSLKIKSGIRPNPVSVKSKRKRNVFQCNKNRKYQILTHFFSRIFKNMNIRDPLRIWFFDRIFFFEYIKTLHRVSS